MRKRIGRSNSFLLEIVLDILLFAAMLTVSLHMIMKSHNLTKRTGALYQAVELCESVADIYEAGDGNFDMLAHYFPDGNETNQGFILHLGNDFKPVATKKTESYQLKITQNAAAKINGSSITITVIDDKGEEIYSTKAFHLDTESKGEVR